MLVVVVSVSDSCITFLRPRRLLDPPIREEVLTELSSNVSAATSVVSLSVKYSNN